MRKIKYFLKKSSPWYIKLLELLFIISLGKFYLNYLLPTNPNSKLLLFRDFSKQCKLTNWDKLPRHQFAEIRFSAAKKLFITHFIAEILFVLMSIGLIGQILLNFYPMWIQIYFGIKSYRLIKNQSKQVKLAMTT